MQVCKSDEIPMIDVRPEAILLLKSLKQCRAFSAADAAPWSSIIKEVSAEKTPLNDEYLKVQKASTLVTSHNKLQCFLQTGLAEQRTKLASGQYAKLVEVKIDKTSDKVPLDEAQMCLKYWATKDGLKLLEGHELHEGEDDAEGDEANEANSTEISLPWPWRFGRLQALGKEEAADKEEAEEEAEEEEEGNYTCVICGEGEDPNGPEMAKCACRPSRGMRGLRECLNGLHVGCGNLKRLPKGKWWCGDAPQPASGGEGDGGSASTSTACVLGPRCGPREIHGKRIFKSDKHTKIVSPFVKVIWRACGQNCECEEATEHRVVDVEGSKAYSAWLGICEEAEEEAEEEADVMEEDEGAARETGEETGEVTVAEPNPLAVGCPACNGQHRAHTCGKQRCESDPPPSVPEPSPNASAAEAAEAAEARPLELREKVKLIASRLGYDAKLRWCQVLEKARMELRLEKWARNGT